MKLSTCRGHPLFGIKLVYMRKAQESVSVTVLLSEASRIALLQLDGNEEALRLYMQVWLRLNSSRNTAQSTYYIFTGIHRCSILDIDFKFCENSYSSRISADKRF